MLYSVLQTEAEIARKIGANGIGVKNHRVEQRRQRARKCCLAGTGQTHNEDFAFHVILDDSWKIQYLGIQPSSILADCIGSPVNARPGNLEGDG